MKTILSGFILLAAFGIQGNGQRQPDPWVLTTKIAIGGLTGIGGLSRERELACSRVPISKETGSASAGATVLTACPEISAITSPR